MKIKLNIKNPQLAKALGKKNEDNLSKVKTVKTDPEQKKINADDPEALKPKRKIKAKQKSDFVASEERSKQIIKKATKEVEQKIEPKKEVENKPLIETRHPTLGPTGKHINDFINQPTKKVKAAKVEIKDETSKKKSKPVEEKKVANFSEKKDSLKKENEAATKKTFAPKKHTSLTPISSKDRSKKILSTNDETIYKPRKMKRLRNGRYQNEESKEIVTVKPQELNIRLPISIKDFASALKLKASEIIAKLFMQGVVVTLNDSIDDETTAQLLGEEFGCAISINTTEEEKIRITDESISEEIMNTPKENLKNRPAVIAFMGHVDHGKTSLIDYIRKSNIASGEKGAITQHIGAFTCETGMGKVTILDTPGHEAFSAMRARGANMTDIVVLVVAGDEGVKKQTIEAIQHAKAAGVVTIVAINKSDKPNFNADNVYRQLADNCLVPEIWGGDIITVNCSAETGDGVDSLLEMLGLQSEILELKANPDSRARGTVIESCMHKGLGITATLLIQNGTLKKGDPLVFTKDWGRVKTLRNEHNIDLDEAGPSYAVRVTGLSGIPEAGNEFIVVSSEKDARQIAGMRQQELREKELLKSKHKSLESILQKAQDSDKKILNIILRADTHGSVEALKHSLVKIESDKAEINILFAAAGEVSESDVQLASASNAIIIGFHTQIESRADSLIKDLGIMVRMHDIIYHAIEDTRELLLGTLDKLIQENDTGMAEVLTTFKASQVGLIAGCAVRKGKIHRNHKIRIIRDGKTIWKGSIASIQREKNDVREISEGFECGIVIAKFNDIQKGDIIQAYEINYINQEL